MNDRLFEESNEERIARLRRRFETGVERAESAHKTEGWIIGTRDDICLG